MKKILVFLCMLFICTIAFAHTIEWYADGSVYDTTTCSSGDNITPPSPPAKKGYTFDGWVSYTILEYIQSSGTQYIDTGILAPNGNATTVFTAKAAYTNSTQRNFVGGYNDTHYCEFRDNKFGQTQAYVDQTLAANMPYDVSMTINGTTNTISGVVINGTEYTSTQTMYQKTSTGTFLLFAFNATTYLSNSLRIYHAQLTINGSLVGNYIPCRRNSDNAIGMYDTVTGKFLTNSGTGTFIAGPAVQQ